MICAYTSIASSRHRSLLVGTPSSLMVTPPQTVKPVLDEISKSKDMLKMLQEEMKGSDDSLKQVYVFLAH